MDCFFVQGKRVRCRMMLLLKLYRICFELIYNFMEVFNRFLTFSSGSYEESIITWMIFSTHLIVAFNGKINVSISTISLVNSFDIHPLWIKIILYMFCFIYYTLATETNHRLFFHVIELVFIQFILLYWLLEWSAVASEVKLIISVTPRGGHHTKSTAGQLQRFLAWSL